MWKTILIAAVVGIAAVAPASELDTETQAAVVAAGQNDTFAWEWLSELCDVVGHRLAGSRSMERAIDYSVRTLREAGFDRVWKEPVMVPQWVRGAEWARMTAPVEHELILTGLGTSPGTPPEGIEAEVLVVRDFEELEARAAEVPGTIVLFNPQWVGYGSVARYRTGGPAAAARRGAVAALVRSATGRSLATPHTGVTHFPEDGPRVPAAALIVEDALRIERLVERGHEVRVRMYLGARNLPDVEQHTVVAEVRGRELPDEVVVVGCHLDSWDMGTGAHDDGAGCAIMAGAAHVLLGEGLRPRRTVRLVLYASEEFGGHAGRAYLEAHREELDRHVAAMESDSGCYAPAGFSVRGSVAVRERIAELAAPLVSLGADNVREGWAGVDIGPIVEAGVPGIGYRTHNEGYFDLHHSPADTLDKVDPKVLADNVAAAAGLVWAIAEAPDSLRNLGSTTPTRPRAATK